jgi:hypothetical protein
MDDKPTAVLGMWSRIATRLWRMLPDKCTVCGGKRGGVRGNENIIDGEARCDYCHVDLMSQN